MYMKLIIDFYKGLDAFNIILFWGIIIVILLLLIFSIIMVNKNKKLQQIIISRGLDIDDGNDFKDEELAIKKENIAEYNASKKNVINYEEINNTVINENKRVNEMNYDCSDTLINYAEPTRETTNNLEISNKENNINIKTTDLNYDDIKPNEKITTTYVKNNKNDEIIKIPVKKEYNYYIDRENNINDYTKKEATIIEENRKSLPNEYRKDLTNEYNKEESTAYNNTHTNDQKVFDNNKKFIAEEYVMEYNTNPVQKEKLSTSEIDKQIIDNSSIKSHVLPKEEIQSSAMPYQRNVLREMYSNQTSPIGITKKEEQHEKEIIKATELNRNLNSDIASETKENKYINPIKKDTTLVTNNETRTPSNKSSYLEDLSKKLNEVKNDSDIRRTSYELRQEEEAIISFKELMEKKDKIQIIDEEEAIISIEELIKHEKEKLYKITPDEEDEEFVNELKKFRNDL